MEPMNPAMPMDGAPIAAPAPVAAPVYEPPPPITPVPGPQFSQGGATSNKTGLEKFFDGITLTDIGIIAIVTAVGITAICYYRKRIDYLKKEKSEVKKKVEELEMNVAKALGPNYKKL